MDDNHVPLKTPEVLSAAAIFTPNILIWGSAFLAFLLVAIWVYLNRPASRKGCDLLLVGPPDAGKTALLSHLAFQQNLPTHTSMQTNVSTVALPDTNVSFKVIDIPGHPRLRGQFEEHLSEAKVVAFVVDSNTVSRNAPVVAEHLHHILHALTSLPPSQQQPSLLILANKCDLLKTVSNASAQTLAINRVKSVLERELEKRRSSQTKGINIEGLGEEGERIDMGGLECGEKEGSSFKFDEWEGGAISFLGTSTVQTGPGEKGGRESGLETLLEWLSHTM